MNSVSFSGYSDLGSEHGKKKVQVKKKGKNISMIKNAV